MAIGVDCEPTRQGICSKEWDWARIGDFALVTKLAGFEYTKYFDYSKQGEIIAIRGLNINNGNLDLTDIKKIPQTTSEKLPRSRLSAGDIVISYIGTIGKAAVIQEDNKYHLAPNVAKISLNNRSISPDFLCYFLNSFLGQQSIINASASTTQAALTMGNLRKIEFPYPPILEQKAIASILRDIDEFISDMEKQSKKKQQIKQGVMQELLTGKTRLPGFNENKYFVQLSEVATFQKGKGISKNDLSENAPEPCVHYGELFTEYSEVISEIKSRTYDFGGSIKSEINDVLMPTSDVTPNGLAKASCIKNEGVILGGDILIIRCNPNRILGSFLSYVIRFDDNQILRLVSGTTVFHIYASEMGKFYFWLPSVQEQRLIIEIMENLSREICLLKNKLAKYRKLKTGMMQLLLTGRTRLI